jgi:hypothetical protein
MLTRSLFLTLTVIVSASTVSAQWIPVHATQSKTVTVLDSQGKSSTVIKEGTYDRSSLGEELTKLTVLANGATETKLNSIKGEYILDYSKKTAHQTIARTSPPSNPEIRTAGAIGKQTIDGKEFYTFPVRMEDSKGKPQVIGTICVDENDNLIVKKNITIPGGYGISTHIVMVRTGIETTQEPDASLFNIPDDFKITTPPKLVQKSVQ